MSQPGQHLIIIHILPNMSRSKGKEAMKFGQLIEYKKGNIFLQKSGRETSSRPLSWFLEKLYMRQKLMICNLVLIYFDSPQLGIQ